MDRQQACCCTDGVCVCWLGISLLGAGAKDDNRRKYEMFMNGTLLSETEEFLGQSKANLAEVGLARLPGSAQTRINEGGLGANPILA